MGRGKKEQSRQPSNNPDEEAPFPEPIMFSVGPE
jgi:hypothetical protein